MSPRAVALLVIAGFLFACQLDATSTKAHVRPAASARDAATLKRGLVLGTDGKPAANVTVRGFVITSDDQLISDLGSSVVSNNGGKIVSDQGGSLQTRRRLLADAVPLSWTTDADGRFALEVAADQHVDLEAASSPHLKAAVLGVGAGTDEVTLKLAPTGTIAGHVSAPKAPQVTNFEGVDVYIPGLPYALKAAADGSFTLDGVPAGTFTLAASKTGLGKARTSVTVTSGQTTRADLALDLVAPTVASITPTLGRVGTAVTIAGQGFGATSGALLQVSFGGGLASDVKRVDDHTLVATVPASAGSGPVQVLVDGVAGTGPAFRVIKQIEVEGVAFDRVYATSDGPNSFIPLALGSPLPLKAVVNDPAGSPIPDVPVTWKVDGSDASVSDAGVLTPLAASSNPPGTVLTVTAGGLAVQAKVQVIAVPTFTFPSLPPLPSVPALPSPRSVPSP